MDTVKDGVTGFHMGKFDADDLVPQDVASVAATVNRCGQVCKPTTSVAFRQQRLNTPCPVQHVEGPLLKFPVEVPECILCSPGAADKSRSV